ncbi:K(+)-transporting ATPase subunit C [Listeria valentina]|uniref:K(+)-transporting ATPase subunit C n=1 Tax=Listeria valentina TaxID=2705293 RepID=UPI001431EF03|nr:K(+)-transporting ATPase subunit C [Listeria valentina]
MKVLMKQALLAFLFLTLVCGVAYPAVVTLIAQAAFHDPANGSIIEGNKGSTLIGQTFTDPKYLLGRPNEAASNLNPASQEAKLEREERTKKWQQLDPNQDAFVPADLVMGSASGVDPHISVAAAEYQAKRIANERGISTEQVEEITRKHTTKRLLGFIGEPVVNVLAVNLELDQNG